MKTHMIFWALVVMSWTDSLGQGRIGVFDNHLDVGGCKHRGAAYYDALDQRYYITGSGQNMWAKEDQFHYLWTTVQGDFILRAEAKFLGKGVDPHRKMGWIIKEDLDHYTKHVNASVHGDGLTSLQFRRTIGGHTEQIQSQDSFPDVIQLERRGSTYIMSTAAFGSPLVSVQLDELALDQQAYVGLYVCAHNGEIAETAVFRNVRIVKPVDPDFQAYRDYIGGHLEIMDVATGHRKIIYSSSHAIQAPNWSVDGRALIFNSKGLLYEFGIETGVINPLETGFARNNNNDHVLSFDGSTLGISHHNPKDNGSSTIYFLPREGSTSPQVVTSPGAGDSYLHGWSPDQKKMVFTGYRNGQYNVHTIDLETGKETPLTNLPSLDDGPEYSPDGRLIYFNSSRTGRMKLWRMEANGKNQSQVTFDDYNDWFPHVSPDMKWIIFISFPPEIDPEDHPFYQHCLLRMMPYAGGEPRIIGYIYGGQGSINVPSWSPDGQKIAFVTNTVR